MAKYTRESVFISYCLRHGAAAINLPIDTEGWVLTSDLVDKCVEQYSKFTFDILKQIVAEDTKGRYSFNDNKMMIRANQGHSLAIVSITYEKKIPPPELYHGTSIDLLDDIIEEGIIKMGRHHVHLSDNLATAISVGRRHGEPAIITIDTVAMTNAGIEFFLSDNGVWLTDSVDPQYFKNVNNTIFRPLTGWKIVA
jgi:putative RNA 2'-phosphotransferase